MRITNFRIENFRNLRLAEATDAPDFIVICGGNGCGKSALLEALMTAKEHAGKYRGFTFDTQAVAADANEATISMTLAFTEAERQFVTEHWKTECPEREEILIEILRGGKAKTVRRSDATSKLLSYYSKEFLHSPGFFDYIDAFRHSPKVMINTWSTDFLSDENARLSLGAPGSQKFQNTKRYLVGLKMFDLQQLQRSQQDATIESTDSLQEIRDFFDDFFSPMKFIDVRIDTSPFQFIVDTPGGSIDIDDLSGGEKEVLNLFVRFHQLHPHHAVILLDEADAHLHPDLERRYLDVLRRLGKNNQMWITTHSPEMMIGAGAESLYTVVKEPQQEAGNQFVRVTDDETLYDSLCELMGSRGIVSFNQRIVFIEGRESSADCEIYERLYPPGQHNVSFVPAGDSATVRGIAERVNAVLSSSITFQDYYSIVDGDIERPDNPGVPGNRLYKLPVYHVENFLLDATAVWAALRDLLASSCPYQTVQDAEAKLKRIVLTDAHLKAYAKALLDARIAKLAKDVTDALYRGQSPPDTKLPTFDHMKGEATTALGQAIVDGTWRSRCKGREVLKALAHEHGIKYVHLRNCVIAKLTEVPAGLADIMGRILAASVPAALVCVAAEASDPSSAGETQ
ncbi:MAG: AAA family ATPase [bacterium]|nr:AAA family ATPase [bacterium]